MLNSKEDILISQGNKIQVMKKELEFQSVMIEKLKNDLKFVKELLRISNDVSGIKLGHGKRSKKTQ